jgi:hypothetical protein
VSGIGDDQCVRTTGDRRAYRGRLAQCAQFCPITSPVVHDLPITAHLLLRCCRPEHKGPVRVELWRPCQGLRGHVRGQRKTARTSCLCLSASSPPSPHMPLSSRAAGAEPLGPGVHVSGWRSARRCAPAAAALQHFYQRNQPVWYWIPSARTSQ